MPYLSKRVVSNYFRTDCPRQLALMLYPHNKVYEPERTALGMPPKAVGRTGINALTEEGGRWEQKKLLDLETTFGGSAVIGTKTNGDFQDQKLIEVMLKALPGAFLVRPTFGVGESFKKAMGIEEMISMYDLAFGKLIPDLIQVLAPKDVERIVEADGSVRAGDGRIGLRVIDIKMTAEPSASYFAEITYYSLALAGWLRDHGFADRYVVVAEAAIWPGSHDAAAIVQLQAAKRDAATVPTLDELLAALAQDIETLEIDVFSPRLRFFFNVELRGALATQWRKQDYHVSTACSGCEYLGYSWNPSIVPHPDHCMPRAAADGHLSSIAFLPRGARRALGDINLLEAKSLATLTSENTAFDCHPKLRATRTVVAGRAQSLESGVSTIPSGSGTSAVLPNWSDLSLYLSADFDVGSGLTLAFGIGGFSRFNGQTEKVEAQVFVNDTRSPETEKREFLNFLAYLQKSLTDATKTDAEATVQIYIWDRVTYEHIIRVIGRNLQHILADSNLKKLAWLFPAEEVIENSKLRSANAPITIVRNAVQALVAAPIPHYYSLLRLAREFRPVVKPGAKPFDFLVPTIFEDPLSDQVPSERAHEIWTRMGAPRPWSQQVEQLRSTVKTKLRATASVVQRLQQDLKGALRSRSPKISEIKAPSTLSGVSADGQIWFAYARLNAQVTALEHSISMASPVHEREARYLAARLEVELTGTALNEAATALRVTLRPGVRIYRLGRNSREAKFEPGDFLCALSPAAMGDFHMKKVRDLIGGYQLPFDFPYWIGQYGYGPSLTGTQVIAIDREDLLVAVSFDARVDAFLRQIEPTLDLTRDVVLDKQVKDFLTGKLEVALKAIGNPPLAISAGAATAKVIGKAAPKTVSKHTPVAEVLWDTEVLSQTPTDRDFIAIRALLEANGVELNDSQWMALQEAVEKRLTLIWGPPGTGKSQTLRAILLGLVLNAHSSGRPVRILVTSNTYDATDNVVLRTFEQIHKLGNTVTGEVRLARLRSDSKEDAPGLSSDINLPNDPKSPEILALHELLVSAASSVIVSAPPQQVTRFANVKKNAAEPLFDVVLIDEASQMDMASAVLALAPIAAGGSTIIVGDPKQLPPIQQVEAPVGLEFLVGSVYDFLAEHRKILPRSLLRNYRSNATIVNLSRFAGYPSELSPHFPDLRIATDIQLPSTCPSDWPLHLAFSQELAMLLDPSQPISAFLYPEGRSSQWNDFEAQTVAALMWLLRRHLNSNLKNDPEASSSGLHNAESFWKKGVGVVTPHRAHKALVVSKLQAIFEPLGDDAQLIRDAVNTVERFQGQQRDVIIATYALGDPDAIADEDEFLLSLNRFNVMSSRPRAKLIVLASQEVINHLPGDIQVMRDSRLLKYFAETYLDRRAEMTLPFLEGGKLATRPGSYRYRQVE
ncbi:MAG: AAA domain-containing protein [Pseudomonas sp.]|uniref:DEAD/DEAH box helicase n=1 Tax=Pseudomonas sp. TaxID=306 RepID=UPI00299D8B7D|nr:AAA domain-containing protein [Pseudomonas sp.]MDX1722263.1 AAA domain-containing protein [Pseudomonas sp.]